MTASNLHLSESPISSRRFLPWMLLLFVGSGCAALIYEIVWLQMLSLVIGASAISLGVLLGTFMGGMCLGSFILPRLIPAKLHPLRVYAILELLIGIIGVVIVHIMKPDGPLVEQYIAMGSHGVWTRAIVAGICLIPPTMLMGATLPAISRYVESTPEGVSWMGIFYGGNIVGAVIGCLFAGFYLLPNYNMFIATYGACAINVIVFVLAMVVAGLSPHFVKAKDSDLATPRRSEGTGMVYLVIAFSGFCALGAEVVWTRLLGLMLGANVYTFSIILAVFLVGLGVGSSWGAMLARSLERPRLALGWCQLALAGTTAWAAWIIGGSIPYWPIDLSLATSPYYTFQVDMVGVAWAVLPGAILWGMSFPLALAAVASRGQDPGRMVGGVYAANTVGAILGSLGFSMLIVPNFGTEMAQRVLVVVCAASAVLALLHYVWPAAQDTVSPEETETPPTFSPVILTTAVVALIGVGFMARYVTGVPWIAVAWGRNSATWIKQCDPAMYKPDEVPTDASFDRYCVYVGEGMNVSVAVTQDKSGYKFFHGAGKVQASTNPQDMRLQRMLGHLSVLAHKDPDNVEDVLVVACGAGVTAGSFIPYPHVKNITICDIEQLVPTKVTPQFSSANYGIVGTYDAKSNTVIDGIAEHNPKTMPDGKTVKVEYDDGRHFIRTLPADKKYDIITSDPIDPWVKGCAALNTVEYYEMCKEHLKPGGVMSLWIPLYESNEDTAKSVIGTFFKVFPNGILFSNDDRGAGYDAVLFGRAEETSINVDEMEQRLERPEYAKVKQSLMDVGFGSQKHLGIVDAATSGVAVDLLSTYAARAADLTLPPASGGDTWAREDLINRDENLRLQYLAGKWLNMYIEAKILGGIFKYYQFPDKVFVGSPDHIAALKQALADNGRPSYPQVGSAAGLPSDRR